MSDQGAPGWLTGLVIVFSLASAITFGLFLYFHSEEATLAQRYALLRSEREDLRGHIAALEKKVPPKDEQIVALRSRIADIAKEEADTTDDVSRLVAANNVALDKIKESMLKEAATYKQLGDDAKTRRLELKAEEERALASELDFDERRLKARESIEALSKELEVLKRESRKTNVVDDDRISELEERIAQLTQQREANTRELRSDGQLLASRATDGFVVVDKGQQNNLRKGTRFTVFNRRGGKNLVKGTVEVVDVQARMATCRVLEELDGNDPLVPGDHIHNPVYNPTDVKIFVIKGDFFRFSRDELKRFIEESGGKVENAMSTNTDYLVAGERSQQALDEATRLGISILSEGQLIDFVRFTPRFAIREGMVVALAGRFTVVGSGAIANFIEKNGGRVVGSVSSGVQVLVAGEGAGEDVSRARLLGIQVVDQSQFSHLAGGN